MSRRRLLNPVRVLFLIDKLIPAGTQTNLLELVAQMDASKIESHVIALVEANELADEFRKKGIAVDVFRVKKAYGWTGIKGIFKLCFYIKKHRIDVIQTHFLHADFMGLIAAKICGIKIVIARRDEGFWRSTRVLLLSRFLNQHCDHVLANSQAVRRNVLLEEKAHPDHVSVIYNGIPLDRYKVSADNRKTLRRALGIQDHEIVIGAVGNMRYEIKGQNYLLDAASSLIREMPNVRVVFAGDGPLRSKYEEQADKLGIKKNVLFLGSRRDIPELLNAVDIFCLPSVTEGFSNAVLEAMACEKPVVATQAGGNGEMVVDGVTGYLVPVKDSGALEYRLNALVKNPDLRIQMGHAGREHVFQHFTADKMAQAYESFYQSSVQQSKPRVLAVVASQFPETHETFVIKELAAMKASGIPLRIYSLKSCRDKIIQPEARDLMKDTKYVTAFSIKTWLRAMRELISHPVRALRSLVWILKLEEMSDKGQVSSRSEKTGDEGRKRRSDATSSFRPFVHSSSRFSVLKPLGVWWLALACADRMRRSGVTHIHGHWATAPTSAARIAAKQLGIQFSFTAHAWDIFVPSQNEIRNKVREASLIVTCTDFNRQYLSSLETGAAGKIVTNYHGVDLRKFKFKQETRGKGQETGLADRMKGRKEEESLNQAPPFVLSSSRPFGSDTSHPLLLSVGRFCETKGYPDLIESYRLLKERGISFQAVIVGEGKLRPKVEEQIRKAGLSGTVQIKSTVPQEELKGFYRQASLFVLPCVVADNGDRDGIPNVAMEAMALGVPVVSTRVSGLPELVEHGKNGWLGPEKNPGEFADLMESILKNLSALPEVSREARKTIEEKFNDRSHLSSLIQKMKRLTGVRKKVLFMIWSLEPGGAERVVIDLAKNLDPDRYEASVLCLNHKGRLAGELEAAGIRVLEFHKKPKADWVTFFKIVRFLKNEKYDLVHTHLFTANFWGRLACALAGVPVVVTEHNVDLWKKKYHFWLDRALLGLSRKFICVSGKVQDFYEDKLSLNGKAFVIYNGIDAARYAKDQGAGMDAKVKDMSPRSSSLRAKLGIPADAIVIGTVGRLVPQKCHADFIDAVKILADRGYPVYGVIVGEGPLEDSLKNKIALDDLLNRVQLTGAHTDITPYYQMMDLFALCSTREGLPLTMLEAMAAEVPVVATNVGGVGECITDGKDGLLMTPGSPQLIADTVARVLDDQALRASLVKNAKARLLETFTVDRMVEEHQKLYQEVFSERSGS